MIDNSLFDSCSIISCDLFDTLVFRTVQNPTDIFDLVEDYYNATSEEKINGFKKKRIEAERLARRYFVGQDDIEIDDIYNFLNNSNRLLLKKIEKTMEIDSIIPNDEVVNFLKKYHKQGKKIIITSDMYLDEATIKQIIAKTGIYYDELFLSSVVKKTKSTGNLYAYIKEQFGSTEKIVHLGDNPRADVAMAKQNGIEAVLYQGRTCFDIGYGGYGPFLYNFCRDLHKKKTQLGVEKIVFCARDGYLIHLCYQSLYPNDNISYLHLNRNIVRLAVLAIDSNANRFWDCIQGVPSYSLKMIVEAINRPEADRIIHMLATRYDNADKLSFEKYDKSELFEEIYKIIIEESKDFLQRQLELLLEYFEQNGIIDTKFMLVNNSTLGTCQYFINKILKYASKEASCYSVQFFTSKMCEERNRGEYSAYFVKCLSSWQIYQLSMALTPFEFFMFPNCGTDLYLSKNTENGVVEIITDEIGSEVDNWEVISKVQAYALQFILDYRENEKIGFDNNFVIKLYQLFTHPTIANAKIVANLNRYDIDGIKKMANVLLNRESVSVIEKLRYIKNTENFWEPGMFVLLFGNGFSFKMYTFYRYLRRWGGSVIRAVKSAIKCDCSCL